MTALIKGLRQQIERRSLATRLALSMVIVAALTVAVQFYDLNRQNRTEIENLQTNTLINDSQTLADQLDALVQSESSRIINLSFSRAAQEFVSVRPDQRSALFTPTLTDFTNFLDSNPFYLAALLLDRNGEVLISTDGSYVGENFAATPFFKTSIKGNPYMSDPGISLRDRQAVIWLSAPIYTTGRPEPEGLVAVTLSPEEIWEVVENFKVGENGYAILVDQYGIRLAHGRDRAYVFRSLVPLSTPEWAALEASQRFGPLDQIEDTGSWSLWEYLRSTPRPPLVLGSPDNETGRWIYYSAASLETRHWTVITMVPEAEILAPADRVTLRGLWASLALILFLGITVVLMANRIVQPVPHLVKAARNIAQGDLQTPIQVKGSSELAELADNFETMRQRLENSHRELEGWAREMAHRVAQRSQELTALSEVVAFASRTKSRTELLDVALDLALRVMDAEMGGIWMADPDDTLRLVVQRGFDHEFSQELTTFAPNEGLLGRVQRSGTPVALEDISSAPLVARMVVLERSLHTFAAVPLRIHGRNLGVLGVFSRSSQPFSHEAVSLAASIGQQIALTLDNLNLVRQVETQARSVARMQERDRIAADIHDSMAQTHGYVYLQVDNLAEEVALLPRQEIKERLITLRDMIAHLAQETRQFIAQLRDVPPPPPTRLDETLHQELKRLEPELSAHIDLNLAQVGDLVLPEAYGTELSRIVGEAVRNAQRHGQAKRITIDFERQNGHAFLYIRDDGCGFDLDRTVDDGRRHFGLSVMKARAARIGGSLNINSLPGSGTEVEIQWPVQDVVL